MDSKARKKALVVDDDREICTEIATMLSRFFDVETAFSADEALAKVGKGTFDVAVVDYNMPGGKLGDKVVQALNDTAPLCRVFMLSANQDVGVAARDGETAERFEFIPKPCDLRKLQGILKPLA